jgi:predicted permease
MDWRAVGTGAAVAVVVTVPPAVVARILKGDDLEGQESNLWVVPVVALFVGFALGGHLAARRRPDAPLLHSAAAAVGAFAALCVFVVVRRFVTGDGLSVPLVVTLALLLQITVSLAVLGGYVAMRREVHGRHRA